MIDIIVNVEGWQHCIDDIYRSRRGSFTRDNVNNKIMK